MCINGESILEDDLLPRTHAPTPPENCKYHHHIIKGSPTRSQCTLHGPFGNTCFLLTFLLAESELDDVTASTPTIEDTRKGSHIFSCYSYSARCLLVLWLHPHILKVIVYIISNAFDY